MVEVLVPRWGLTMEEAVVSRWMKQEGDLVAAGEPLVVLETDKASGEVEAPAAGRLSRILVPEGATVRPGEVLAQIEPER